ncbi:MULTISPECIES: ABC transporter permease [unclassified Arthrobacter]|uniref:ABC transporter permease n=1 Tax=unclassified Arthrobacter TaxID=235627 RepID=UPI00159EAE87|nr:MULTISPECIES: ABC transporter permease [unclassified Arthrobacter]MCQ9162829.1 ABC transporter permease [Arthrobacter sp. STN4]NVM98991.1 ABC transporter permease [Arthrobacter sp. SDTb3-6]
MRKTLYLVLGIGTPVILILAWFAVSAGSTDTFFPPLSYILERFQALWLFAHFQSDILVSLLNLVIGFALASVIGVGLGFVLAMLPKVGEYLDPVIHFFRSIPPVALVPIFVALIGFGVEMRVTSIAMAAVFPTLIATVDGLRGVDSTLKDVSAVYRLSTREKVLGVYLPAAGPHIASGMQVSLQTAFVVMIASEMLGPAQGIGAMTLLAQQSFMIADMWSGILLLGVIGFAANMIFELGRRRLLAWYIGSRQLAKAS